MGTHYQTPFALLLIVLFFTQCIAVKKIQIADINEETVRLWFEEGWNNNRQEELLERCFSPNWSDGNPLRADQLSGYDGMRQLIKVYKAAFPDAHFTITHLFADISHVAVRYEVAATHEGEMFGIPPTGREFYSTGIVLYDMERGKIKTSWQELDLMGIINQLKE